MADKDFLGVGMKFPPQINKATGRFMTVSAEESVRQSLYLILMTHLSERPMRPDFGSELMSYTFMDVNAGSIGWITRTIREQIALQEPRVSDVDINTDVTSGSGMVLFDIRYRITDTNTLDNLVFPFYLNAQTEEEAEEEKESIAYEPQIVEEVEY
ncbi:MAG: GPW/gp25 family protein [Lachnospiraceae bacterium]|nr:GPW/gp25 family protein [Lachnospiraceae bacterium]